MYAVSQEMYNDPIRFPHIIFAKTQVAFSDSSNRFLVFNLPGMQPSKEGHSSTILNYKQQSKHLKAPSPPAASCVSSASCSAEKAFSRKLSL